MARLFKDKYLIALYDKEELCVAVFDNCRQMARAMGKSINVTQSLVGHFLSGDFKIINYLGTSVTIHLIPDMEEINDDRLRV